MAEGKPPPSSWLGNALACGLVALAMLLPRAVDLDRFATVDEPSWIRRSANFYYALGQRDFAGTYQEIHPGVLTMWAGASAALWYFPEYRGLGQGQFLKQHKFEAFLDSHGKEPLELLRRGRLLMVLAIVGVTLAAYAIARRLYGLVPALAGFALIALDPFHVGHSRLLTHEGLMSSLLLLSILALLAYLRDRRGAIFLAISAAAAAGACLTKSTGVIVVPFVGLLALGDYAVQRRPGGELLPLKGGVEEVVRPLLLWLAVFTLIYVALWPAMWVAPLDTLAKVYGAAWSYKATGVAPEIASQYGSPTLFELNIGSYLESFLWHTTPLLWLGLVLAALGFAFRWELPGGGSERGLVAVFTAFAGLFVLMMGVGGGRTSSHYIMSAYISLDLVAGVGFAAAAGRLGAALPGFLRKAAAPLFLSGLLAVQAFVASRYHPYFFNYSNPLMRLATRRAAGGGGGYGEGLDLAARYLAQKPGAEEATAMSWYGVGPFSYFYPGETRSIQIGSDWTASEISDLEQSDYLVIYYVQQRGRRMPAKLMRDLGGVTPETTIVLNGIEYIRIYRVSELPAEVFMPDPQ